MISLAHGADVPLRRPVVVFGERTYPEDPTRVIRVARRLNPPRKVANDTGAEAVLHDGVLYVYRGEDVQAGDKIELPEGTFYVHGRAENDMVHPFNGHDFGIKRYRIESGRP